MSNWANSADLVSLGYSLRLWNVRALSKNLGMSVPAFLTWLSSIGVEPKSIGPELYVEALALEEGARRFFGRPTDKESLTEDALLYAKVTRERLLKGLRGAIRPKRVVRKSIKRLDKPKVSGYNEARG